VKSVSDQETSQWTHEVLGCDDDGASWNPLLSDTDFIFNIRMDSNADLLCQLCVLANNATKQEFRIRMETKLCGC